MSQSFLTLIGTVCENIDVKKLYDVEYMGHDSVNRYSLVICIYIYIFVKETTRNWVLTILFS